MQAPAFATIGRGATHQGDQVRFGLPIEEARLALFLLFTVQAGFQAAQGEALAYAVDGGRGDLDRLRDVAIPLSAVLLGFVGQEQDTGALALSLRAALGFAPVGEFLALRRRQGDMILFRGHG